ncbi:MAG: hypothetical protein LBP75_07795 [Planctomycetota bacterium]|jgi:hypothetical protein|nr:hypothetical protein [Planctomycetota bacterium]
MALDQRFVVPLAPDEENGKINVCIANVVKVCQEKVFDKNGEAKKETIDAALAETAKKVGIANGQTKERAERPQNPRVQIIERGKVVGASR